MNLVMCEGSAEMNTLLHSARFQSEIDDVLRDSVSVENVTSIYENNITIQSLRERCSDAEEERKSMRRLTFEEDKLARFEIHALSRDSNPIGIPRWRF